MPGLPREEMKMDENIKFSRIWAMPNKRTFSIPPIAKFISRRLSVSQNSCDPFCGDTLLTKYRNDIRYSGIPSEIWLKQLASESMDLVLYDAPYSPRQLKECYDDIGASLHDTKSSVWKVWKEEIARITSKDGVVLSFGWQSSGIGKSLGFKIEEILLVPHGGNHHDTICVAERKL